nr:hypothetical protein [uncultured Prevotella sp.]
MNRKEAKILMPVIQAFADGKDVETKTSSGWISIENMSFAGNPDSYRIKPEPKYRPFNNAEECWQEMQKHQPFGWVKCKEDGSLGLITLIISEENIFINGIGCNSERTMRGFTFADGKPFGVIEEE